MQQQTVGLYRSQQVQTAAPCSPIELNCGRNLRSFADPDAALVEALKARSATAFDDLVKRYEKRLLNTAMKITKNREDAEDVVQESFLKVFKNIDRFRLASKFATWLTRIVINQALMLIRSNPQDVVSIDDGTEGDRFHHATIASGGYTPEQLFAQREFELVALNPENVRKSSRQVMDLRVNHGLSEIEIAQVLSLTLPAVKARLYRGRLDLREAMSRNFHSARLARAHGHKSTTTGKREQHCSFMGDSGLAGDNPSPARYSQPTCELEPSLPYRFSSQLLTCPHTRQISGPQIAF